MANSQIYICDWCESFVEGKELHRIQILIKPIDAYRVSKPVYSYEPSQPHYPTSAKTIDRDICSTCAERLVEEFKLTSTPDTLNEEAFKNFQLPLNTPRV